MYRFALITVAIALSVGAGAPAPPTVRLGMPIACTPGKDCEIQNYMDRDVSAGARDYKCGSRTYDAHSGLDIRLPDMVAQARGVAVLAAADGRVARLRDGQPDMSIHDRGAAAVKGQECGNGVVVDHGDGLSTQYCHLAKGSIVVTAGQKISAGATLGKVGLSGQTEYPHLHMTVRRGDQVIDPFAPEPGQSGACGAGADLWTPEARRQLVYKSRAVLNAGFSNGPVDMARIEAGTVAPFNGGGVMVAYVRATGLQAGDRQRMTLKDPSGRVLANTLSEPLPRDQAQRMLYIGARMPPGGWQAGRYESVYNVLRDGQVVLSRTEAIGP